MCLVSCRDLAKNVHASDLSPASVVISDEHKALMQGKVTAFTMRANRNVSTFPLPSGMTRQGERRLSHILYDQGGHSILPLSSGMARQVEC